MVRPAGTLITVFAQARASIISFHPEVRKRIDVSGRDLWLEVDAGVKADNAKRICSVGADTLVAGSAIFNGGRYQQATHAIRMQASAGRHARVTLQ